MNVFSIFTVVRLMKPPSGAAIHILPHGTAKYSLYAMLRCKQYYCGGATRRQAGQISYLGVAQRPRLPCGARVAGFGGTGVSRLKPPIFFVARATAPAGQVAQKVQGALLDRFRGRP